ncbi:2OG-Fe(II) oxygenase [Taklimakanibacter lacteus]|uniref:2OG-Fe(II) oxygenase n=1 Tax=Taklimakanibacter lacteus TaxID=2268456 RepID=UPI0013C4FA86
MDPHFTPEQPLPSFAQHLVALDGILPEDDFARLVEEVEKLVETERSYLPAHKKGGTVAYETLERRAPRLVALYRSQALRSLVSNIVRLRVEPTPLHDQSSCSVLFYDKPGDHIGWHYDHNFYRGRHFTVLIPMINRGREPSGLSQARLMVRQSRRDRVIATPPNTMIVFEGAEVRHKVTPIAEGEKRVVWSMTYCTDPRNSAFQGVARRIKDTAFFGLRALWT